MKQWDIEIQVSYDLNQSTLGSSSTILQPLSEARGLKICSNGQQIWLVDHSSKLFNIFTSVLGWRTVYLLPKVLDSNHNLLGF